MYDILNKVDSPENLKKLTWSELGILCSQIRDFLIENVTKTGGHLASNLGVVELSVALHLVYDAPKDKIVWDVGHQSYVHKILTGRRNKFNTLRCFGGLSGFPKTNESIYDSFNTGHSSTSASSALGMARARDLKKENFNVCAVFGDGALTGGMIYEALNDVGHKKTPLVFILNDNEMSISENVGALSRYLQNLRQTTGYRTSKKRIKDFLDKHSSFLAKKARRGMVALKEAIKVSVLPSTFFDDLGIEYLGPVDGHNIKDLVRVLTLAKNLEEPVLVHIITKKGKGYAPAEENPQMWHGISPKTCVLKNTSVYRDYSQCAGKTLMELASSNKNFVTVSAAMPIGVGLSDFSKKYSKRFFDVGICEEHAVTFCAGLAKSDITPVFCVYSSFLQRSYDQILHDVCLQNLHVVFLVDRAGIVGSDGETHHGLFDISYLCRMPNMTVLSPASFSQLEKMLDYAINIHKGPIAIRYPRGFDSVDEFSDFSIGTCYTIGESCENVIISSGRMLKKAIECRDILEKENISVKIINISTITPVCKDLYDNLKDAKNVLTIEDHSINGGLGSLIAEFITNKRLYINYKSLAFPNCPIVHGTVDELDDFYGLSTEKIYNAFKNLISEEQNG